MASSDWAKALYGASSQGDEKEVRRLLEEGTHINASAGPAASSGGKKKEIGQQLDRGAGIDAQSGEYGNALQAASLRGHEGVVNLLLDKGAHVNAQGGKYGNALQAASCMGNEGVMNLLLEEGAHVNAQGGEYGNALQAALWTGYEGVVKLLLEEGAHVNAQGGKYGNALQAASCWGYERVVKLLLDKGAHVNTQGGKYGNALQAASCMGHKGVVNLLLEKGAHVNAQGGEYGNALQAASWTGNKEVVNLLLEKGAWVNAEGGKYGTTLQAASRAGHEKVTKLLIKGADINAEGKQVASSIEDYEKGLQPLQAKDVNARTEQHDSVLESASHKGHERVALEAAAESGVGLGEITHVPMPEATGDYSFGSGWELTSNSDKDLGSNCSTATMDNSSGSEIINDDDEDSKDDGSALLEYDSPLASLRDRISNPVEYFHRIRVLAHLVYEHSTLQTYSKSYSPRMVAEKEKLFEPCPRYPESLEELMPDAFDPVPDPDVMRICQSLGVTHNAFASDLLEILECRNVNAHTYSNLKRLQLDGFCMQKFSILTIDAHRHNVARLLPIDTQQLLQILEEIESVLKRIAGFARNAPFTTSSAKVLLARALEEQDNMLLCVPCCTNFLDMLGLVLASPSDTKTSPSITTVLRLVVNTVDLAVVSYAGAHLSRFDEEFLGEDIVDLDVLGPFDSLLKSQIPSIKLSRCHLQCLDSFHNSQPVWVFSLCDWKPRGHLFLSTKVEEFADIWGPLWKVVDPEVHTLCIRYAVGNGFIYKWKSQKATPRLHENETLCHWISNITIEGCSEDSPTAEKLVFPDIVDEALDGDEILLIGAVAAGCERLTTNRKCSFDLEKARSALDHDGKVQMLGTVKEHLYKDSETYQLLAGHGGVSVSASKQYKRRSQSLKQALVELWTTTPELRDPRLLQDFYGLEVSLCTQNAQRIQLGRILGLSSMCQHLTSFNWMTECAKQAYFDALDSFGKDNEAFQQTWEKHNQYHEDFGRAVLVCLKALEKTGINHKGQLSLFLSSKVTARPELIAMEPKEHSWIGLLKDNEISCCMAVIGDECLEFQHRLGSICGSSGRSVLRTALVINGQNKPHRICKKHTHSQEAIMDGWKSRWSVRNMEVGSDVWLGRNGTLSLLSHLSDGTLLMNWRYVFSEFMFPLLNQQLSLETCLGSIYSLDVFSSSLHPLKEARLTPK